MIKVIADIDIPYLKGVLEPFAEVTYLKGKEMDRAAVRDADALLIRTRTHCDSTLLEGSKVKFIASATIGTDHVDREYLASRNIHFENAPGCNAGGVMQYVHTALFAVASRKNLPLEGKTFGVIGVGNTGGRVAALAEHLGFKVLRNDPPKEALRKDKGLYCPLEYLLEHSDIISMHVPLDETTEGMGDRDFFSRVKPGAIFINASRGEVVVDEALEGRSSELSALILDVWNGEPGAISEELVAAADIATPHIAGYSYEGKINGTAMVVQAFARYFGIGELEGFAPEHTPVPQISFYRGDGRMRDRDEIAALLLERFPVYELDKALRSDPGSFEKIRAEYKYRREFRWR